MRVLPTLSTGTTILPEQKGLRVEKPWERGCSESLVLFVHLSPGLYFKIWSFDLSYFIRCFQAFDCGLAVVITGQRSCCFLITFWGLIPY